MPPIIIGKLFDYRYLIANMYNRSTTRHILHQAVETSTDFSENELEVSAPLNKSLLTNPPTKQPKQKTKCQTVVKNSKREIKELYEKKIETQIVTKDTER